MGQPVYWDYQLTIAPTEHGTAVTLHRIQRGTDTRFLWLQTTLHGPLPRAEQDAILQELYTGCVALMELTA
jgi:hypothetical protein